MRQVTEYGENHAYVLANSKMAEELIMSFCDYFMKERNYESFIFIAHDIGENIILLHFKEISNEIEFDSALQLIKQDIQNGDICADDKSLQKALKNPQITTAELLLDYIKTEEQLKL